MTEMKIIALVLAFFAYIPAEAAVYEARGWRLLFSGFAELDLLQDTRPSFLEVANNFPVTGPDTPRGPKHRKQISIRNSRFNLTLLPPGQETWKTKIFTELDFMGNRLNYPLWESRDLYYTDPALRFRHYYFSAEHDGWQFLVGQTWSLFGWQPTYQAATVSISPGPGTLSQRLKQFLTIRTYESFGNKWQLGLAFSSAASKQGQIPNVDFGARYSSGSRASGFSSASGEIRMEPLSSALSGTFRKFGYGAVNSTSDDLHRVTAYAGAFNVLVPVIASSDGQSFANTLTFAGEYSRGTGYGGNFGGWSGNLPQFPWDSESVETYMNKGYGGFDSRGKFHLFQLESFSAQLQYHFPGEKRFFSTLGVAALRSLNVRGLGPVPGGFVAYDQAGMSFLNLMHDFTKRIRGAIEYAHFTTKYIDGSEDFSDRYQLSFYFRF